MADERDLTLVAFTLRMAAAGYRMGIMRPGDWDAIGQNADYFADTLLWARDEIKRHKEAMTDG